MFLGITCGILIGHYAREELDIGREHFRKFGYFLLAMIILIFLYLNQSSVFLIGIPLCLILLNFHKHKEVLFYWTLGLIFSMSYFYNGFTTVAPLIFLYGFPAGSEFIADRQKQPISKVVLNGNLSYAGFLVIGLLTYYIGFVGF